MQVNLTLRMGPKRLNPGWEILNSKALKTSGLQVNTLTGFKMQRIWKQTGSMVVFIDKATTSHILACLNRATSYQATTTRQPYNSSKTTSTLEASNAEKPRPRFATMARQCSSTWQTAVIMAHHKAPPATAPETKVSNLPIAQSKCLSWMRPLQAKIWRQRGPSGTQLLTRKAHLRVSVWHQISHSMFTWWKALKAILTTLCTTGPSFRSQLWRSTLTVWAWLMRADSRSLFMSRESLRVPILFWTPMFRSILQKAQLLCSLERFWPLWPYLWRMHSEKVSIKLLSYFVSIN